MVKVYLSLGSNLGDREGSLNRAVTLIGEQVGEVTAVSSFMESEAVGFESEHKFLNCAVCVLTELTPMALLRTTQEIERALGRTQKSVGGVYKDRTIDIDILLYGDLHIDTTELKIPHPRMQERDFVLIPLNEIKPC